MTPALSYCPRDQPESCQLSSKCEPDNNDEKKYTECVEKAECSHCKPRCEYDTYSSVYNSEGMTSVYYVSNSYEFELFEDFVDCGDSELQVSSSSGCRLEGRFTNKNFSDWLVMNMLAVEVTYSTNQVEVWETSPDMTDVDLASSVGGSLGLYFGISIFSLFEFGSSITAFFWFVCLKCKSIWADKFKN